MSSTALPLLFLLSTMSGCLGMEGGKEAAALEDRYREEEENWPHINPEDKVHQGRPLNPYQFSEFFDQSSSSVTKELLVSILGSSHTYDRPIWRGAGGGGGGGKGAGRPQGAGDMQQQEMGERVKQAVEKFFIHFKMAFLTLFHMLKGTEKVVNDIEKFIAIEEKYHHYTKQWIVNFISMVNSGR